MALGLLKAVGVLHVLAVLAMWDNLIRVPFLETRFALICAAVEERGQIHALHDVTKELARDPVLFSGQRAEAISERIERVHGKQPNGLVK